MAYVDYGSAAEIDPDHKYKPAVSLCLKGDVIQLLS